jgi:phosphate transport system permease protein
LVLAAGLMVLVILALIVVSTTNEAWPWFADQGFGVLSTTWNPSGGEFGAGALLYGTVVVAAIGLAVAVPLSIGLALFVTEIAPGRLARPIVSMIDLLAAVPSVVFGLWALRELTGTFARDVVSPISDATSGVPLLEDLFAHPSASGLSFATAGVVVGVMVAPIVTSIIREVFATTPRAQKEAALALGATRWEMIRGAVFPHSRGGIVAAVMIGFGRAVGETIAVFLVVGSSPRFTAEFFGPGDTAASIIAGQFGEATSVHRSALIGLGVLLLVLTIAIGMVARTVLARSNRNLGIA